MKKALYILLIIALAFTTLPAQNNDNKKENDNAQVEGLYKYSPKSYRDPFVSPFDLEMMKDKNKVKKEGLAGMLFSEVVIQGTVYSKKRGKEVLILGNDNKFYWTGVGGELEDGKIIEIGSDVNPETGSIQSYIVFRQEINDPNQIKPYRDIKKYLNK
jgi:hypothetical protein